jgi:hypothetical protein
MEVVKPSRLIRNIRRVREGSEPLPLVRLPKLWFIDGADTFSMGQMRPLKFMKPSGDAATAWSPAARTK